MPTYVYEYEDTGEQTEIVQRMSEPHLDEIDGRIVRRIPCLPELQNPSKWTKYPYVSSRLPTTVKGCKMVKAGNRIKPLIESERHEREVMARNDLVRDAASNELD